MGYLNANPNEYHITMDYHLPELKEAFYSLVRMSDGLTECYRPGTFDRWKQSFRYVQEMNPRFIYVWGGGFGYGPKCFGGSYDILGQAHAGLASVTGFHESVGGHATKHSNWCIDWYSGTQITFGILAALHWRRKTGLGTMIEFSQVQAATPPSAIVRVPLTGGNSPFAISRRLTPGSSTYGAAASATDPNVSEVLTTFWVRPTPDSLRSPVSTSMSAAMPPSTPTGVLTGIPAPRSPSGSWRPSTGAARPVWEP
jgi:crotonobetainyl-CoA:carnitine CoA-transferase CaiB-like acyl-CoA transferase